jgi:hypothetical protein
MTKEKKSYFFKIKNMDKNIFNEWFEKLGEAWSERNPQKIRPLFREKLEYFESVFEEPVKTLDGVMALWELVPLNQDNVKYDFKLIATDEDTAIANWKVSRTLLKTNKNQQIDGIFIIKLDENGLCYYFKQRRAVKLI